MAIPNLQGKTAIITGAGSGINLCFAKLLLSKKVNVVFADLALRPEAKEVVDAHSSGTPRAVFQQTDVRAWEQLNRMFETCEKEFGSADIVCPGAGIYEPLFSSFWNPPGTRPSTDSPTGDRYAQLDINITHPIRTTQLAISHFLKHNKPGSIVHISSIAAQGPGLLTPVYAASKAAVSAFVRSLASLETPLDSSMPKIRVTAVAPGTIRTPLLLEAPDKLKRVDEEKDTLIEPEEIADRMLELVMRDDYVGGTVLEVGKTHTRKVAVLNDPGPSGPGTTLSNRAKAVEELWDKLATKGWGEVSQP